MVRYAPLFIRRRSEGGWSILQCFFFFIEVLGGRRSDLSQDYFEDLFEGLLIFFVELSQSSDDKRLLHGGEDGLYDGRFNEACRVPMYDHNFAKGREWFYPAGYGHDYEVGVAAMIGGRTN